VRCSLLVIAVTLAVAGCAMGPNPKLSRPGGDSAGRAYAGIAAYDNQPVSIGAMLICVTSPGRATITHVAIHGLVGNLRVDAFAVRPGQEGQLGNLYQTLDKEGGGFNPNGPQVVTEVCPSDPTGGTVENWAELAVQVTRTSGDIAGGPGVDVTYEAGGAEGTYTVPFGIELCASTCPDTPIGW